MTDITKRGRLNPEERDEAAMAYTSMFEQWLFEPHLWIDRAHAAMLAEQGILRPGVAVQILDALDEIEAEGFEALPERSDVHVAVEETVIAKLGEDVGGRMHTARSRNDKEATALRVAVRWELLGLLEALLHLRDVLAERARDTEDWLISGYTHAQNAQPTTLGHHLLSHEAAFARDTERIIDTYERVNRNPLGGAAFAGTGFPVDRRRTSELLGFDEPVRNSMDAVASRDFAVESLASAANASTNLSRLCEDLILWSTTEFGFAELADRHAASSSIMPQKKNPITPEIARARTGTIDGVANAVLATTKGLPMSFNMDLLEASLQVRDALRPTTTGVRIIADVVESTTFDRDAMEDGATAGFSAATELADTIVRESDTAFRTAHHIVGRLASEYEPDGIDAAALESIAVELTGDSPGIDDEQIELALSPRHNVAQRDSLGGPGEIDEALEDVSARLDSDRDSLGTLEGQLSDAADRLDDARGRLRERT